MTRILATGRGARAALAAALLALAVLVPAALGQGGLPGTLTYRSLEARLLLGQGGVEFVLHGVLANGMDREVVPGYGYVRISAVRQKKLLGLIPWGVEEARLRVSGVKVLVDGKPVDYKVVEEGGGVTVKYNVWRPIPPGGTVDVELRFTVEGLVGDGLLFREYSVTLGFPHESVERLRVELEPRGGWLCYASPASSLTYEGLKPGASVRVEAEVSKYLPLPLLPLRGSIVFWLSLAVLGGAAVLAYRRHR